MFARLMGVLALTMFGCAEDDPRETPFPDGGGDGSVSGPCDDQEFPGGGDNPSCKALADDYSPGADDSWDPCVSDDDEYHPFDLNISTIARVAGFEDIGDLLFGGRTPSAADFVSARLIYAEDQGLESRVSRREDEHYPAPPEACRDLDATELAMYPERCVGPAQIGPVLNDAFVAGANGEEPRVNAARIEAALLWFLYVSVYKEATTCTEKVNDCDSSWAYYTGGEAREGGLGLSGRVRLESVQSHDRAWDGVLAVRCWRDLDNPEGTAMNLPLRDRARAQLDRGLLRGVALIVRSRLADLANACPEDAAVHWSFLQILGPVLDREATERDATRVASLRAEFARTDPTKVDVAGVISDLDAIFPCP